MAKVIGFDERVKKRITCYKCAAIIEYVDNEVQTRSGIDYTGGSDGEDFIKCPNCSGKAIIRSW